MRSAGVTLIELVVTIAILGIMAAIATLVLVPAFNAYFDTQRRAEMADVADTAVRRMTRDVRLALPNSARVDGSDRFLEILMTKNGGRYRAVNDDDGATTEDPLDFGAPDTVFDTLGPLPAGADQQVQANDYVVIHNLGIAGANAWDIAAANPNVAQIAAFGAGALAGENRITLAAATRFPLESPGRRFFVVSGPVTYACVGVGVAGGEGLGSLRRWSGYAIDLRGGLPPTTLPGGATEAILANNLSACELQYTPLPLLARGLVAVRLAITRANETVTLYYEAHVNNVP
ncbi:MAG TPA: prepilin-type N-terminal cleavage/methylation domain-containing protein [Casimicrobiaceae bacterium]|nr:prepilin-type N-terminal cleavage/methylation domain-containing protein [Casimicrobiaceae bacterium]